MAQTVGHDLAQPPETGKDNWVILSMSAKQSDCIEAQVSGYLSKFVVWVAETDQLPFSRGIISRALPLSL